MAQPRIAVVGAGVGGLTTALALAAAGMRCTVFERAPAPAADGFGIQVPPNASRILHRLGLGPALDAVALRPAARELRRWSDGALLGRTPLGEEATRRYGAPYYAMRRADLVRVLYDACDSALIRFSAGCVAATSDGVLRFADGTSYAADLVVGADGLHSVVRTAVSPPQSTTARVEASGSAAGGAVGVGSAVGVVGGAGSALGRVGGGVGSAVGVVGGAGSALGRVGGVGSAVGVVGGVGPTVGGADGGGTPVRSAARRDEPRFIGYTAYRAVLPVEDAPSRVTVWLGPGRHCVTYPVPGGLNLVAIVAGSLEGAFVDWHAEVRDLVAAAAPALQHGLFDRPALPTWHRDRLVVIGDAAHPMPPFVAQGAAQAIEDACALATILTESDQCADDLLKRFESQRRPRIERVIAASAAGGREYHLPDGAEQRCRDERIAASGLPEQDWLYRC
jgi:2-polyprenyl-6-methoxyphenol hydroxylase-like FAD-dependent oxidoreductase